MEPKKRYYSILARIIYGHSLKRGILQNMLRIFVKFFSRNFSLVGIDKWLFLILKDPPPSTWAQVFFYIVIVDG